jgi:DNA polymerase III delta prime subunit
MPEFELLREARHEVGKLVTGHHRSLREFRAQGKAWFKLFVDEEIEDKEVRHKTTTASCLESLDDTARDDMKARELIDEIAPRFATAALGQEDDEWESEAAAYVYCRVRTLPAILRFAPDVADRHATRVAALVDYVWDEVDERPRRQGVYEQPELAKSDASEKQRPSYPPNAFHTFWALRVLHMCSQRDALKSAIDRHGRAREVALLWTQNMLASQVALQSVKSDRADPNQLAWALIAQFVNPKEPAEPAVSEFARRDLYEAALNALFRQQLDNGIWPLGQPIFHYPKAGNAYCYTFETLTELLRPALVEEEGALLRDLLLPHLDRLMKSVEYADRTAQHLSPGAPARGWSSGHHPHRTHAEGWATAAVFSYLQCLRRLLAKWTRDEAARDLQRRPPKRVAPLLEEEALATLVERGDTWRGRDEWSVSEQLAALFLHPITAAVTLDDHPVDPDLRLVAKRQARSAILFGPPGTSKTTLVEALAASVGWEFIEIHASDFLSQGMDHVPTRADQIFERLMELDHCVVLFDEIDELLRERQEAETDPFGRFLTTSMLPKLAELWEQRRVLFFVATNDITHADRAIKRSQRFDAAIFVPPPALEVKLERLRGALGKENAPRVALDDVEEALKKSADENPLGYLALLRYDQIDELAAKLGGKPRTRQVLETALAEMGEGLKATDWHHWPRPADPDDDDPDPFDAFRRQRAEQRWDYRDVRLILVEAEVAAPPVPDVSVFSRKDGRTYMQLAPGSGRPPASMAIESGVARADALLRYDVGPRS